MRYAMIGLVMAVMLWQWLREQRALSAGAIGAGGGAAIGAITGGDPMTGALIGGAAVPRSVRSCWTTVTGGEPLGGLSTS